MSVSASRASSLPDFAEDICLRRAVDGAEVATTSVEVVNIREADRAWWMSAGTIQFAAHVTDLADGGDYAIEILSADVIDGDQPASVRFNVSKLGSFTFGADSRLLFPNGARKHLLIRTICEGGHINYSLHATRVT